MRFIKKYGGVLYVVLATLIVAVALTVSDEMPKIVRSMGDLDVRWIWASALCVALYLMFRAVTLTYYLRREGVRIKPHGAMTVTLIGQFYSAITPSASGGQPMQVLTMRQYGVPVSTATAAVSVKYIGFQLAVMLVGGVLWAAYPGFVGRQLGSVRWLVILGYFVNLLIVAAVLMTVRRSRLIDRALSACVRLGVRLRLIRDREKVESRARAILDDYRGALKRLIERPAEALAVLLLSFLQVLLYMGVIVCLYRAFRLTGFSGGELMTLQFLLFITAAFVPLPGAAGAQEGGFYLFFQGVFPNDHIIAAMLCWRFFTYYALLISGLVGVIFNAVRGMLKRRKRREI